MKTGWNASRFTPDDPGGFYKSYFQRANHPTRPLAFWIRYTALRLRGSSGESCGELWAIYFDGERNRITAVKETRPMSVCSFSRTNLDVRIDEATLTDGALYGVAASSSHGSAALVSLSPAKIVPTCVEPAHAPGRRRGARGRFCFSAATMRNAALRRSRIASGLTRGRRTSTTGNVR